MASKNDIGDFVKQTDFDDKLKTLIKRWLQIKQNILQFRIDQMVYQEKLNCHQEKKSFFLGRKYFTAMMIYKICSPDNLEE